MAKHESPADAVASIVLEDMADKGQLQTNRKKGVKFIAGAHEEIKKAETTLEKSILSILDGPKGSVERLAYVVDPNMYSNQSSLYRRKMKLLPDYILKRIAVQDPLVASILLARANQMSAFGRPQPAREATGYKIEISPSHSINLSEEEKERLRKKVADAEAKILTCGSTSGIPDAQVTPFSEFLYLQAKNALTFGRIATEIRYRDTVRGGRQFHSFRTTDAGTIYPANEQISEGQEYSETLKRIKRMKELDPNAHIGTEEKEEHKYVWYQVINDTPMLAFRDDEMLVQNFYPSSDVELGGFPVTPLDTVITAITTHLNIMTHNKLYFQSGRAAKGMLVIQSDDVDQDTIAALKQHYQASINSVQNSWRTPIIKVERQDSVQWVTTDVSGRDGEFQYLFDTNIREIITAFQMSPEELPGYSYLSKGTNSQSLSESNGEYKLEAHRDLGIRPLLSSFQNFINTRIFPLIDPELAKIASFKFLGLDALSPEQESVRLQQDMAVHMTINDVLEAPDKKPIDRELGGDILLNPQWQAQVDKYVMTGEVMEAFFGRKGAAQDPRFQYLRDPFFFQWQQLLMQQQQMQQQQEAQAQQAQMQQAQQAQGQLPPGQEPEQPQGQEQAPPQSGSMTQAHQSAEEAIAKAEHHLNPKQKALIRKQESLIDSVVTAFQHEAKVAVQSILTDAKVPKKKS